ncbi:hypothetical protein CVT24_004635 [Panaeolus cyanescens]|uniref:Cytochrome P450 n=1 Tax=Panaeolus cyanescens TaxID=181874 RepID=A0A409YSI2_9AGAR|nr:hypothetical protein CVT24_004635 [Panaeolus cyanescens]
MARSFAALLAVTAIAGTVAYPYDYSDEMVERDFADYELDARDYLEYLEERDFYEGMDEYAARDFYDLENLDTRDEEAFLAFMREEPTTTSSAQTVTTTTTQHPKPTSCTDAEVKAKKEAKKEERKRKKEEKKARKAAEKAKKEEAKHHHTTTTSSESTTSTPTSTGDTATATAAATITSPPAATAVQTSASTTTGKNGIATVHVTTTAAVPECTKDSFFKKLFHHHKRATPYEDMDQMFDYRRVMARLNRVMFGEGILSTLGDHHRKQRKLLNPLFSVKHLRNLTPTIYSVAHRLEKLFSAKTVSDPQEIDILAWTARTALEVVGQSGFGYSFEPLTEDGQSHPFSGCVKNVIPLAMRPGILFARLLFLPAILKSGVPWLWRKLTDLVPWSSLHELRDARNLMHRTASEIYQSKKTALHARPEELDDSAGKDILSILMKENMKDSEEDAMSEEEILAQITSITFAATETTSGAMSRILHQLALNPDIQERLRKEVRLASAENQVLDYDTVSDLPLLDAVCRETLRMYPPLIVVMRSVLQDSVLPLSKPVQSRNGQPISEVFLSKGDEIFIPLINCNCDTTLWGPDAEEWKPDRWLSPLPLELIEAKVPGIYAHSMSFIGGSRSCIGAKFAQLEIKILLSVLLSKFTFAPSSKEIKWQVAGMASPTVVGEGSRPQLPLLLTQATYHHHRKFTMHLSSVGLGTQALNPLAGGGLALIIFFLVWKVARGTLWNGSILRLLPGPPSDSWIAGSLPKLFAPEGWEYNIQLGREYGSVLSVQSLFGTRILYMSDPLAMYHVFVKDQDIYEETEHLLLINQIMFGPGILSTVGSQHRKQRKLLNPVFSVKHLRTLTPKIYSVGHRLEALFLTKTAAGPQEIDVLAWMARTSLEVIGQSGFGYSFEPLTEGGKSHPFSDCVKNVIPLTMRPGVLLARLIFLPTIVKLGLPRLWRKLVDMIPWRSLHEIRDVCNLMHRTALEIYEPKKQALQTKGMEEESANDILSILMRENLRERSEEAMSEEEVLAQISSIVFAATETTSGTMSRILHLLSLHADVQEKLRNEIVTAYDANDGHLDYDTLSALPYLDAVCRETLRMYPPLIVAMRSVQQDTVLPLSKPVKTKNGKPLSELPLSKGTDVLVPLINCNCDRSLWGPDAEEWKPERWLSPLPAELVDAKVPGIYSHLMSFLGGGRSCMYDPLLYNQGI